MHNHRLMARVGYSEFRYNLDFVPKYKVKGGRGSSSEATLLACKLPPAAS